MSRDHTQEALDEYYSTGIDPTGGDIGPDFDEDPEDAPMDFLDQIEAEIDARLAELKKKRK